MKEEFRYLLADTGSLITIDNNPDKYVELRTSEGDFLVPISMPRRNPELQFDLSHPESDESLWEYLSDCNSRLNQESISQWVDENKKSIHSKSVTDKLLNELLDHFSVCYSCFSKRFPNPNPQKNIQYIRDRGYIVCTMKQYCPQCNCNTTTYRLTPILSGLGQHYEVIPKKLKARICELFQYTDIYTGIRNPVVSAHIPDHKFPEDRWDSTVPKDNNPDMSDEDIIKKFQLLDPQSNMQKQRFCGQCVKTGKRGYPFGIKYYYKGDEAWDNQYPTKGPGAEAGCEGCGWYDIEKWRASLNEKISKMSEEH